MQLPKRRHQTLKIHEDEGPELLTAGAIERMHRSLADLKAVQRPQAVTDLSEARAKGDLSENAEYQEAKGRLSRIDGRIFSLTERLKRAVVIERSTGGEIRLGSCVIVEVNGKQKTYDIVGPREADPSRGRISHVSPLGEALTGHVAGDTVTFDAPSGPVTYRVVGVE